MPDEQRWKVMSLQTQKSQEELQLSCQTPEASGAEKPEKPFAIF
jgi:hypothetical protein